MDISASIELDWQKRCASERVCTQTKNVNFSGQLNIKGVMKYAKKRINLI